MHLYIHTYITVLHICWSIQSEKLPESIKLVYMKTHLQTRISISSLIQTLAPVL